MRDRPEAIRQEAFTHLFRVRLAAASLWVALVSVTAHLLMLTHMLFVAHVRCEHGQLVHRSRALSAISQVQPSGDSSLAAASELISAPRAGEEHDHCAPLGIVASVPACTQRASCAFLLSDETDAPVVSAREARAVPILRYAPKTSPTI